MRARSERQPRESNRSTGRGRIELLLLIGLAVAIIAVACGESSGERKSSPASAGPVTVTTPLPAPDQDPSDPMASEEASTPVVAPGAGAKEPIANGLCVPAGPLGVSAGESWTLSGSVLVTGPFPGEIPSGAVAQSTHVVVTAIVDSTLSAGDRSTKPADYQRVEARLTHVWSDSAGSALASDEADLTGTTISVSNLGPALTLDWECYRAAWLAGPAESELSVEERALSSGVTAVVFSSLQSVSLPDQGMEMTMEIHHGYDKQTGRLVLQEGRTAGTLNGAPFTAVMSQELVSEPADTGAAGEGPAGESAWLRDLIARLGNEPVSNPPALIVQYDYAGHPVYFVPQRCCDIFSDLYDADGDLIGNPDGGITGQGDGRVSDFFEERSNERIVWRDERKYDSSLSLVQAPVESVDVQFLESFPVQYMVVVVSGQPNSCVTHAGYYLNRSGDVIRVEMLNKKPVDPDLLCAQVYGTVETRISLGSDFDSGETYRVEVNDVAETFVAQ